MVIPGETPKTMSPKRLYVPKCQIASRYGTSPMSLGGKLVNFGVFQDQHADDSADAVVDDGRPQYGCLGLGRLPRLERWSPTGPRSLLTSA
jgi:hypothetical protein